MALVKTLRSSLVALMLLVVVGVARADEPESVHWEMDIDKAKQMAKESGRPMLIFVTMQGCHYCTQMKETTLVDPALVDEVNDDFVSAYVDESTNRELVRSLGIRSFPTTLIATPDGRVREMVRGYVGAEALRQRMRTVRTALRG